MHGQGAYDRLILGGILADADLLALLGRAARVHDEAPASHRLAIIACRPLPARHVEGARSTCGGAVGMMPRSERAASTMARSFARATSALFIGRLEKALEPPVA